MRPLFSYTGLIIRIVLGLAITLAAWGILFLVGFTIDWTQVHWLLITPGTAVQGVFDYFATWRYLSGLLLVLATITVLRDLFIACAGSLLWLFSVFGIGYAVFRLLGVIKEPSVSSDMK